MYSGRRGTASADTHDARLLERERELDAFDAALTQARGGTGSLLFVEGHPGAGKTSLLEAMAARAGASTVLSARGGPTEQTFAFGLALQLFEPWMSAASPAAKEAAFGGMAALAVALFEEPAKSAGPSRDPFSTLHGLFWLTAQVAEDDPLLLFVDDAQWCDEASLRFVLYLAQRVSELPVLGVVAARPDDPDEPEELLTRLRASSATRVLEPGPLSEAAVGELVAADHPELGGELAEAILEATGGNPFLVHELLLAIRCDPDLEPTDAVAWVRKMPPDSVCRHVTSRLSRLPDEATALARAAAVLGEEAMPRDVAELAGVEPGAATCCFDLLARCDILAVADRASFVHPLIRSAVYSATPPVLRADIHAEAARVLSRHAPEERVASHLLISSRRGDQAAVRTLRSAASRTVARGAPETACAYLRRALEEPPAESERPAILIELADAEVAAGELAAAVAHFEEALGRISDPIRRAELRLRLGRATWLRGRAREAAETFEAGRRDLGSSAHGHAELDRSLRAAHATTALIDLDLRGQGAAELEEVLEEGDSNLTIEERELLAVAASQRALMLEGDHRAAGALARRALDGDHLLRAQGSAGQVLYLGVLALCLSDELDLALNVLDAAVSESRERGSVIGFANASYSRGSVHYLRGSVLQARADLEAALEMRRYGWEMLSVSARGTLAHGQMEVGDLDGARESLDLSEDECGSSLGWPQLLFARSRLRLLEGDPRGALADLERTAEQLAHLPNPAHAPWRSSAAYVHLRLGNREEALRLAAEEVSLAREWGAPRTLGRALRALGVARGGDGGIKTLIEAVALLEASPARLERARALTDLGSALRRSGQHRAAREPLAVALELAEACGATVQRDLALDELRATGARPRVRAASGPDSLTPGELRVARLAASGKTNREIAADLFVTVKAVEWHLRNAYRKLAIGSRKELVGALRR